MNPAPRQPARTASLLLAAALLVAAAVGCLVYWTTLVAGQAVERREATGRLEQNAHLTAVAVEQQMDALLRSVDTALKHLRLVYVHDRPRFDRAVRDVLDSYPEGMLRFVTVFDAQGYLVYSSSGERERLYFGDREHFRTHAASAPDRLFVGPPIVGRLSGEDLVQLTRPVREGGRQVGVIGVPLRTAWLAQQLGALLVGSNDLIAVVRPDGRFVTRTRNLPAAMKTAVPADRPFLHAASGSHGLYRARSTVDAMPMLFAWSRMRNWPLAVAVGVDESARLAPLLARQRTDRERAAAVIATILAITLGIAALTLRLSRANARLAKSESGHRHASERSRSLLMNASDGIHILDPDGRVLEASDSFCRMLGYERHELLGANVSLWDDHFTPEGLREAVEMQLRNPGTSKFETRHRRKDGTLLDVEITGRPLTVDGRPALFNSARDITERKRAEAALAESEDRFRRFFEANSCVMLLVEPGHGAIVDANPAAVRFYGHARGSLLALSIDAINVLPPEVVAEERRAALARGRSFFQCRHRLADGDVRDVEVYATPVAVGGRERLFAIIHDVTQRVRAEGELRKLSRAVEQSPASIVITDRDGRIEYVNPAFESVTGYTLAEVRGQNPRILKSGVTPSATHDELWETITSGRQWNGELCNRRKDGTVYWERAAISGIPGPDGAISHFVAVKHDVTAQREADERLKESEHLFSTVFHASPVAIVISRRADGTILEANDALVRLVGRPREQIVGRTATELGLHPSAAARERLMEAFSAKGALDDLEVGFSNQAGQRLTVAISVRGMTLRGEACLVALLVDVTARRQLEEARLRSQNLASLGTLAGGVAHDFNNLLAAIRGNALLAAEDVGDGHPARTSLGEIERAGERAAALVRRITAFARPVAAARRAERLQDVVEEVLKLLRATLPASIDLRRDFAAEVPPILADAGQVHEAVVNLTTNAAHAIGADPGWIRYAVAAVRVSDGEATRLQLAPGDYVCLTVADSGCGMEPATMARVFDAFFTTKPIGEGTGLGLSMVYGTMQGHGGTVTVESAPGRGTTFRLYFPVATGVPAVQAAEPAPAPERARGHRILFVDDEESLVFLAQRSLTRLGYRVSCHTDAREAVQAFRAAPGEFDLVVTDLSMPRMSGFDFARSVKQIRPDVPVVLTSGYVRPEDEATAREAGIHAVVTKPSTIHDLVGVVDRIMREGAA